MSEFDILLYRPLKSGKEFEGLLPKSECKITPLGNGLTDFSIEQMKKLIDQYNWQTTKLASVLQSGSLEDNAAEIKDFIFNHFQYKADDQIQNLRTPACSWYTRKEGIDCKSYSILASCLLLNLGITHYIRKIKQPGFAPTDWTHVYVVVPVDQQKADLTKGYYTIDGTLEEDQEPAFIKKSDLIMEHNLLNAPHKSGLNSGPGTDGYGTSKFESFFKDINFEKLFDLKNISFDNIGELIRSLTCGDSSYPKNQVQGVIDNIQTYFQGLVVRINQAAAEGNTENLALAVCEFYANAALFVEASKANKAKGWNPCTTKSIDANIAAFNFYREIGSKALEAWLSKNFDITNTFTPHKLFPEWKVYDAPLIGFTTANVETKYGFRHVNSSATMNSYKLTYVPKPSVNAVNAFELTEYVATVKNPENFNALEYLATLTEPLFGKGTNPINPATGEPYQNIGHKDQLPQEAGLGVLGYLLIAGAAYGIITTLVGAANKSKGVDSKTKQTLAK